MSSAREVGILRLSNPRTRSAFTVGGVGRAYNDVYARVPLIL